MNSKVISIIVLFIIFVTFLQAQVYYNQEFQVNTITENDQHHPKVCVLSNNNFVVCWQSEGQDGSVAGVYCQLFQRDGTKIGTELQVNTVTLGYQDYPSITNLTENKFLICWSSTNWLNDKYGIFGQFFESNGTKFKTQFPIDTSDKNELLSPCISDLIDGGFVVCWSSDDVNGTGIFGQLFEYDGKKRGEQFQINSYTNSYQNWPGVACLETGEFVVCWESPGQDGSGYGIYGQIFNSDGSKYGDEFQVNTYSNSAQGSACVSNLSDSGFVVCWESYDGYESGIFGQIFNYDGSKRGTEFLINTYTDFRQSTAIVTGISDSRFVVCWTSEEQDGSGTGIFAQLFENNGIKKGSEFQVNTETQYRQYGPSISSYSDSGFVVCWESYDGYGSGIFAKYYLDPIIHSLKEYSLLEPVYDTTIKTTSPLLKWQKASPLRINLPYELEYKLYLDDNNDFIHPQIISGIYNTTCVVDSLIPSTTYFWKVLAKNIAGDSLWSSETNVFFVSYHATKIKHQNTNNKLQSFELYNNYPNPFNPETIIKYNLPLDQSVYQVKVKIYDALGQLIATLVNKPQNPGLHTVKWNGKNAVGQNMSSGIYFCVVEAGKYKDAQKMILVR